MRSSSCYAFSFLAYSDKWNGYGWTDEFAGYSVAFCYNLLLFVKGGKISITVFLLFYCDVCDRRNDFWLNLFLWIICFGVPTFKEWAKNWMAHQKLIAVQSVGCLLSFSYVFFSLMFETVTNCWLFWNGWSMIISFVIIFCDKKCHFVTSIFWFGSEFLFFAII